MGRVLLVEDDLAIAEPLARALRRDGHEVSLVGEGNEALTVARRGKHDLMVLDIGLPGIDGIEVCRVLREEGVEVPILMLTARADEMDVIVGLDVGADDYVSKPFRAKELMARIRVLLRRTAPGPSPITVQDIVLDPDARTVTVAGEQVNLSVKEFDLLHLLMRNAGSTVSRDRIMREVWRTDWWGSSKTLDMHVSWLRRKLGDDAHHPRYLVTVRGIGLRFDVEASA